MLFRRLNGLVFAAALTLAPSGPLPAQTVTGDGFGDPGRFADYLDAAEALDAVIDRQQFDLGALGLALALETPETIAAHVDARIATQIYPGAMRGADGTLRAAAGNSLDQALLLQRLLIDAGQEARIARTTLDDAAALRLVAAVAMPARAPALTDQTAGDAAIARMEDAAQSPGLLDGLRALLNGDQTDAPLPEAIQRATEQITATLGSSLPSQQAITDLLVADARDYFWVQTRLFGTDDWQDLHVAFTPEAPLVPESFVAEPWPEDLTHRIHIAFELEIRESDRLRLMPLMDEIRLDTLGAPDRPIVMTILPDGVIAGAATLEGAEPGTTFHFPLLNGEIAPRGLAFTADGLTAPAADVLQSNGMAGIVAATASGVSEAGGLLSSLGADAEDTDMPLNTPLREVTALWVTVTIDAPGQQRQVIRRTLVDRIGADLRAEGQVFAPEDAPPTEIAMLGQWMLMIQTGGVSQAELLALQIDRLREMAPGLAAGDQDFEGLSVSNPAMQAMMTGLFDTAAEAGAAAQGSWTYRRTPGVLIASQTYDRQDGALVQQAGIDVLGTGRVAIGQDGTPNPMAAVAAGVAETLAERIMADAVAVRLGQPPNATSGSWDRLAGADTLQPIARQSDIPDLPAAAREAMAADLDRGYALALAGGDGDPAWWRVDQMTGATIGVDAFGRGGESAEYITVLDAVVTKTFAVYGTISCAEAGGNAACCAATNIAWAAVGFSIWGVVGKGLETFTRLGAAASGWIGLAGGAGMSATGWNPYQGPC